MKNISLVSHVSRLIFSAVCVLGIMTVWVIPTPYAYADELRDRIYAQVSSDPGSSGLTNKELNAVVDSLTAKAQESRVRIEDVQINESLATQQTSLEEGGVVSCFDYYSFGSVQVQMEPTVSSVVSGTPITFTGQISNQNAYPVVDGTLYVKVFRLRDDTGAKNVNGPHVVDQYVVQNGLHIPAKGAVPLSFTWNVPSYALSGEYQIAAFFTTSQRFNLLGLSFTDDVIGNSARFSVSAERTRGLYFDKDAVTVNNKAYYFAAFPPRIEASAPATVQAYITNRSTEDAVVPVTWKTYAWDAQRRENLISEQKTTVTVKAGARVPISYTVKDTNHPVYLVEGALQWHDAESFINIRFVRPGIDQLRINFPSITAFPLEKGKPVTLFSCLHNTQESMVSDGRLELQVLDSRDSVISSYTYEGAVGGEMMGVAKRFIPTKTYDRFTLVAKLYQGDTLVDNVKIPYDCQTIDPASCKLSSGAFGFDLDNLEGFGSTAAALILATLLAIGAVWIWWRHEQSHNANDYMSEKKETM